MEKMPTLKDLHALTVILNGFPVGTIEDVTSKKLSGDRLKPEDYQALFIQACVRLYPTYSVDEAKQIFLSLADPNLSPGTTLSLLVDVSKFFFRFTGDKVLLRFENMIHLREGMHLVGQSIPICALFGKKDAENRWSGRKCDFSPYTSCDNLRLRQMLSKGIAENHFHLKGSAPTFLMSWVCLMNHQTGRVGEFSKKEFKSSLFSDMCEAHFQNLGKSLYPLMVQAAAIRFFFWRYLSGTVDDPSRMRDPFSQILSGTGCMAEVSATLLHAKISAFREAHFSGSLDYVWNTQGSNAPFAPIAGEHHFIYRMFLAYFSDDNFVKHHIGFFFRYLQIFLRFRRELVQVNSTVGFGNFKAYEERKDLFLEKYPAYKRAQTQMAYASALSNPSLKSLEARVVPKERNADLKRTMKELEVDAARHFAPGCMTKGCRYINSWDKLCTKAAGPCAESLSRVFHVFHFVKEPEEFGGMHENMDLRERAMNTLYLMHQYRHFNYRKKLDRMVESIVTWRETGTQQSLRVYGIDACNHEIGCRPEVFAPLFRRLRSHRISPLQTKIRVSSPPELRVTFHVGEDFLDMADGLRAIDECIRFLEMRRGDRLGHALALGTDAHQWYRFKHFRVFLPAQDLLDNLSWLYGRLGDLGLRSETLGHALRKDYENYYAQVYGAYGVKRVPLETYFEGWKLRGDHPRRYRGYQNSEGGQQFKTCSGYFEHDLQDMVELREIRDGWVDAAELMHQYHFNPKVKRAGRTIVEYPISSHYAEGVQQLQYAMQQEVAERGIGIECNPSSNCLIGTFNRFDEHPIVRFNDDGLCSVSTTSKLHVSINTDDQGIFDTDLENEYALIACALEHVKEEGQPVHKPSDVYRWLDIIRQHGLSQSFMLLNSDLNKSVEIQRR